MAYHKFCVSWQPGTFGNLIRSAIIIQQSDNNIDFDIKRDDSHDISHNGIFLVHPHNDSEILDNMSAIKPYFETKQLTFFPKYLHYLKHFKSLPNKKTIKNYYDIDSNNFYKDTLRIYWNYTDSISNRCFNIKMDNLFYDFDLFIKDFESYIEEKIKSQTLNFLQIKRDKNLIHLENFTENIINGTYLLEHNKSKNIQNLLDYEKLLIICTYVHENWDLTYKFLKSYNNQEIVDVMDIYSLIHDTRY